ncbi:hypothetical protein EVG20_g10191 [Dentipellis fragilis]|uniref:COQ9 C-terminal domain-containing protein n=1 Tax=Dentipellis fragilis TaxID=205917 RepID=A0A4Y9XV83_9AGAM|nr:hypothetical protein EVG20_g10191 [Dentipellis fragilis]
MAAMRARLLQLALPLVKEHGFTRETLARSVLALPEPRAEPLTDSAVSALFGEGDNARRTLIQAWLEEGRVRMRTPVPSAKDALRGRLRYNEPALAHLPEAFALLASPKYGIPPLDVRPAFWHAAGVADEACYAAKEPTIGAPQLSWYSRRASLAAVYTAAELHQLTSPETADAFLDSLLDSAAKVKQAVDETQLFSSYVIKSWAGIIKSSGVF